VAACRRKQRFSIELTERVLHQEKWASAGAGVALTRRLTLRGRGEARQYEFGSLVVGGTTTSGSSSTAGR
jgi:hypothetical protein